MDVPLAAPSEPVSGAPKRRRFSTAAEAPQIPELGCLGVANRSCSNRPVAGPSLGQAPVKVSSPRSTCKLADVFLAGSPRV